jgi:hypothetical protein
LNIDGETESATFDDCVQVRAFIWVGAKAAQRVFDRREPYGPA